MGGSLRRLGDETRKESEPRIILVSSEWLVPSSSVPVRQEGPFEQMKLWLNPCLPHFFAKFADVIMVIVDHEVDIGFIKIGSFLFFKVSDMFLEFFTGHMGNGNILS